MINASPENAVVVIGATSDQPRAKQTAELYGDALSELQKQTGDETYRVITKSEIDSMAEEQNLGPGQIVRQLEELVTSNPNRRVVIDYPLMVKQLAYKHHDRWTDQKGAKTEYFSGILKKHGNNHAEAGKDWIANAGHLEIDGRVVQGPQPEQVAKDYLEGIKRLHDFVEQHAPGRPLVIGEVGHQWDLDAVVTYLGNNGVVDEAGFQKVTGGDIAGETEITTFTIDSENPDQSIVRYRGKEFPVTVEV